MKILAGVVFGPRQTQLTWEFLEEVDDGWRYLVLARPNEGTIIAIPLAPEKIVDISSDVAEKAYLGDLNVGAAIVVDVGKLKLSGTELEK